jgi:putative SOS response-associated peptidase YedK
MCGRITRISPRDAIANEFGVTRFAEVDWHPRYNAAPSQVLEAIVSVNGEAPGADAFAPRLATPKESTLRSLPDRATGLAIVHSLVVVASAPAQSTPGWTTTSRVDQKHDSSRR